MRGGSWPAERTGFQLASFRMSILGENDRDQASRDECSDQAQQETGVPDRVGLSQHKGHDAECEDSKARGDHEAHESQDGAFRLPAMHED